MISSIALTLFGIVLAGGLMRFAAIRKNVSIAEATGFKVFRSPVYMNEVWWFLLHNSLVPILSLLPSSLTRPWLKANQPFRLWHNSYKIFEEAGCDTMIFATPQVNMLTTCDPVVMHSISSQPKKMQQDPNMTKFLAIWGENIASSDGEAWKHHRRVVNSGFTPSIYAEVWRESSEQTQTLIDHWQSCHNSLVPVVMTWMTRLALHIVSTAFFRKKMTWDQEEEIPQGHQMGFKQALNAVIDYLPIVALFKDQLAWLPFKATKKATTAFVEWTNYMKELRNTILDRLDESKAKQNKSLLESIVVAGTEGEEKDALPEDHALGNIFLTLLAGHDTSANTMAFIVLLLAMYPDWQRRIQEQLDQHLGDRPYQEWSYEQDFQALFRGPLWAVIKESMRLYNVVSHMFRITTADVTLTDSQGVSHEVPKGTVVQPNFGAAWRNPNRWATNVSAEQRARFGDAPAIFFDPARWLADPNLDKDEKLKIPRFFPFGQGIRKCPGERFGMVEMTSVFATIYKNYSVELEVSEQTLRECRGNRLTAWEETRDAAIRSMSEHVVANMNIQILKEIPLRVACRKAEENH